MTRRLESMNGLYYIEKENPPITLADFAFLTMSLLLPKLFACRFDLLHFTCDDKDGPFANIRYTIGETFEIVSHPQQPVGAFDGRRVLNHEDHQLTVNLKIQGIHFIVFNWDGFRSFRIFVDE